MAALAGAAVLLAGGWWWAHRESVAPDGASLPPAPEVAERAPDPVAMPADSEVPVAGGEAEEPVPEPPELPDRKAIAVVAALLEPVAAMDAQDRRLRRGAGLKLFGGEGLLVPLRLLNGAVTVRAERGTLYDTVVNFDGAGMALLQAQRVPAGLTGLQSGARVELLEPGEALYALAEPGRDPAFARVGRHAGYDGSLDQVLVAESGSLEERFLVTGTGEFVGMGAAGNPSGRSPWGVLPWRRIEAAWRQGHPQDLHQLQLHFDRDAAARRDRAALYFAQSEWLAALENYVSALEISPSLQDAVAEPVRQCALLVVQDAVENGAPASTLVLLDRAGVFFRDDPEVLLAQGVLLLQREDWEHAVYKLGDALHFASGERREEIQDGLRRAYLRWGEALREEGQLAQAAAILEDALGQVGEDAQLLKSLGYALYESGASARSLAVLERAVALEVEPPERLLRFLDRLRSEVSRPGFIEITFDPREGAIRTRARLNGLSDVPVLVDTGASLTAISEGLAQRLGLAPERATRHVEVTTASGRLQAPLVTLATVDLAGARQANVDAIVLPLEDPAHAQALIGLNFLSGFDVGIDADRGILRLTPLH